jgi:hypothetical protein
MDTGRRLTQRSDCWSPGCMAHLAIDVPEHLLSVLGPFYPDVATAVTRLADLCVQTVTGHLD